MSRSVVNMRHPVESDFLVVLISCNRETLPKEFFDESIMHLHTACEKPVMELHQQLIERKKVSCQEILQELVLSPFYVNFQDVQASVPVHFHKVL